MNSAELESFNRAVGLAQAGQKEQAQAALKSLETTNPNDANLLLWLAFTSTNLSEARDYLDRAARNDPANPSLAAARTWLAGEEAKQAPPIAATSTYSPYSSSAVSYGSYAPTPEPTRYAPAQPQPPIVPELVPAYQAPAPTLQPAISQGVPDWYRPERDDEAPERRRTLIRLGIIAAGVVVVVGVIALILSILGVFGSNTSTAPQDKIAAQGVPIYPGMQHIVLKPDDQTKFDKGLNSVVNSSALSDYKLQLELYSLKASEKDKMQAFFDTQLKGLGWTSPPNGAFNKNSFTGKAYLQPKEQKVLVMEWATVSKDNDTAFLAGYNVSEGDLLLVLATLEKPQDKS